MDTVAGPAFEILLSLAIGIGLSAACGFRVFVPFLVMSIAAQAGYLELASGWEWIGSLPALITFAIAAVLEVVAYYVPWLDNLLDTKPPLIYQGSVFNTTGHITAADVYDDIGRRFYLGARVKFAGAQGAR